MSDLLEPLWPLICLFVRSIRNLEYRILGWLAERMNHHYNDNKKFISGMGPIGWADYNVWSKTSAGQSINQGARQRDRGREREDNLISWQISNLEHVMRKTMTPTRVIVHSSSSSSSSSSTTGALRPRSPSLSRLFRYCSTSGSYIICPPSTCRLFG